MQITTSERKTWQSCQQKWFYSSPNGLNLTTPTPSRPLWFGTGYHAALAGFYDPATPRTLEVALEAWHDWFDAEEKRIINAEGVLWGEEATEFQELRELGEGMLGYYCNEFSPMHDHDLECVWVERAFKVRIKPRSPYIYAARPDALFLDPYGNYWIGEWKTAERMYDNDEWLELDDQTGSYIAVVEREMGVRPKGVLHTTQAKAVPGPLKQNKNGHLSRDLRQTTTYNIAVKQLREHYGGHIPPEFSDLITKLSGEEDRFVKRVRVDRNSREIETQWALIEREAKAMRRAATNPDELTRSPSRFNCQSCFFRQPCIAKYEGSDEQGLLNSGLFVSAASRY